MYRVIGYRKKVILKNLSRSFPQKSQKEIEIIVKKFYKNLSDIIIEIIKMRTISKKEIRKRVKINNLEYIHKLYQEKRPFIGIQGHYTNWEWVTLICPMLFKHKSFGIYKPLSNSIFDQFFHKMRARFGLKLVPMKEAIRPWINYKSEPIAMGIVGDQTPSQTEGAYWTTFLNQPTLIFTGIEKIAQKFDASVVFLDMQRIKRGYYELTIVPLADDSKNYPKHTITELHVRFLEKKIVEKPEDWLWSHRRWKHKARDKNVLFNQK